MKTIFTAHLRVYATGMLCTFLSLTSTVTAQTDLVKWDGFTFGPPVSATSFLPMNSGKELTNGGQSNGAFVGNAGTSSGHVLIANGWDAGNYFQVNFATSNYTSNTITFLLGAFAGGAKHFKMQYALSSGGPFIDFGSSMNFGNDGGENVESWNLPAACINQPDVYIRITSTSGSTISGGGNYIDNITVAGTAMAAASITQQPYNSTTCESTDAVFSLIASNGISYQWQYRTNSSDNFADVPNGAPYDGATTAIFVIEDVTLSLGGYQFRCLVTGGIAPVAISDTVTLSVEALGTWNGSINSNWHNHQNWNCGALPTATSDITIDSSAHDPIINDNDVACYHLAINSGATLSFNGNSRELDIKGSVSGCGTLDAHNAKVIFSGTGPQNVPASTYKELHMNGSGPKTLTGNVTVTEMLTLTDGTLSLGDNNITIAGTGDIDIHPSASSFIVTDGNGALTKQNIGVGGKTGNILFPIGANTSSYTPLVMNNATGALDNFTAQVKDGVFSSYSGTTGIGILASSVVGKTWFLTEGNPGGSNVNLQLTWNGSDEMPGFDRDNCVLSHYTGGSWNAGPVTFAVGADPYTASRSGITSFSPFGVGSAGSPLPLDLVAFYGKRNTEGSLLNWTTVNEYAVKNFEIERSPDVHRFEAVGSVIARNTQGQNNYDFLDAAAASQVLYYRLKINDVDGQFRYSPILRINAVDNNAIHVYPNPAKDILNISIDNNTAQYFTICDLSGRVVFMENISEKVKGDVYQLALKSLSGGSYVLHVYDSSGGHLDKVRFIKQ